jgi:hypothetical protein
LKLLLIGVIRAYSPAMSIDTTVLDTSKAATLDLAWSLEVTDTASLGEPEPLVVDDEQAPPGRYSWWLVWRNAVLLVVAAALAALAVILVSMREGHAAAPAASPPSYAAHDPSLDPPVVCDFIASGYTPQQIAEGEMRNGLTTEDARAHVAAAIAADCPASAGSATAGG